MREEFLFLILAFGILASVDSYIRLRRSLKVLRPLERADSSFFVHLLCVAIICIRLSLLGGLPALVILAWIPSVIFELAALRRLGKVFSSDLLKPVKIRLSTVLSFSTATFFLFQLMIQETFLKAAPAAAAFLWIIIFWYLPLPYAVFSKSEQAFIKLSKSLHARGRIGFFILLSMLFLCEISLKLAAMSTEVLRPFVIVLFPILGLLLWTYIITSSWSQRRIRKKLEEYVAKGTHEKMVRKKLEKYLENH